MVWVSVLMRSSFVPRLARALSRNNRALIQVKALTVRKRWAASPELHGVTNKFFSDRKELPCKFRDPSQQKALWMMCEQMTSGAASAAA